MLTVTVCDKNESDYKTIVLLLHASGYDSLNKILCVYSGGKPVNTQVYFEHLIILKQLIETGNLQHKKSVISPCSIESTNCYVFYFVNKHQQSQY